MTKVQVQARSAVVRAGLEAVLRSSGIAEIATDGTDADVVVAEDPLLPEGAPIVLLTDEVNGPMRPGIRGLLPRTASESEIVAAVSAVAAGLVAVHPLFLATVATALRAEAPELDEPLTPREIDVLRLLTEGVGNKEIAHRLHISEHTVKFHVASLLDKLHAASRTEAVSIGLRAGLVTL